MDDIRRFTFWVAPIENHGWPPAVYQLFGVIGLHGRLEKRMTVVEFESWRTVLRGCGFELRQVEHRPDITTPAKMPANDVEFLHRILSVLLNATAPFVVVQATPTTEELDQLGRARVGAARALDAVHV